MWWGLLNRIIQSISEGVHWGNMCCCLFFVLTDICQKKKIKKSPALQSQIAGMFLYLTEFIDHQQPTAPPVKWWRNLSLSVWKASIFSWGKVVKGFPMTTEKLFLMKWLSKKTVLIIFSGKMVPCILNFGWKFKEGRNFTDAFLVWASTFYSLCIQNFTVWKHLTFWELQREWMKHSAYTSYAFRLKAVQMLKTFEIISPIW